jgi:hypothetical protein
MEVRGIGFIPLTFIALTASSLGATSADAILTVQSAFRFDTSPSVPQMTNGVFQFRLAGLPAQGSVIVEASSDLSLWVPIFTNSRPADFIDVSEPVGPATPRRFYRAFIQS